MHHVTLKLHLYPQEVQSESADFKELTNRVYSVSTDQ